MPRLQISMTLTGTGREYLPSHTEITQRQTITVVTTVLSTLKRAALFGMISTLKKSRTCEKSERGMVMNVLAAGKDSLISKTMLPANGPSIM
jgi:hypothetical protein